MELRFGKFPEGHFFITVVRPFVEWSFKFCGWLIIVSILQYGYEKTGNVFLHYANWALYALVFLFIYGFVQWVFAFKRKRFIRGDVLISAVDDSSNGPSKASLIWEKVRGVSIFVLSLLISMITLFAANIVTTKLLDALLELQKNVRS